jgi:hypothetical protein
LPWFDEGHQWKAMPMDTYLVGARILVDDNRIYSKISNKVARSMLVDWRRMKTIVAEPDVQDFVESMHVDLCVSKLGVAPPHEPLQPTAPSSISLDMAKKLVKCVGPSARKPWPPTSSIGKLLAMIVLHAPSKLGAKAAALKKGGDAAAVAKDDGADADCDPIAVVEVVRSCVGGCVW